MPYIIRYQDRLKDKNLSYALLRGRCGALQRERSPTEEQPGKSR